MSPRRRTLRLDDPASVRTLASPARIEIIEALQVGGPATVAQIADRLGRRPDSLYHHLRRLEQAGIVEECDRVTEGGRAARVLRMTAETVEAGLGPKATPGQRRAISDVAAPVLRIGERDVRRAAMSPDARTGGKRRNLHASRNKLWLTRTELEELNEELDELCRRYATRERGDRSELFALTTVLVPLEPSSK